MPNTRHAERIRIIAPAGKVARPHASNLRIALLTPEFPSEIDHGGGLSNYLGRLAWALKSLGHEPEVFTLSSHPPETLDHEGIVVHRVAPAEGRLFHLLELVNHYVGKMPVCRFRGALQCCRGAAGLAGALERRHAQQPFDLVQSSDYALAGLFVRRMPGRLHLVRSSSLTQRLRRLERMPPSLDHILLSYLERRCVRRADKAYAPSRFTAEQYRRHCHLNVGVVRPPFFLETQPGETGSLKLPKRYLLHFGNLGRVKGSDLIAEALPLAWREEPELQMVWAGNDWLGQFDSLRKQWGPKAFQVLWLGPLPKPRMYAVLRGARATVAPSRYDNLPNSVLESLRLGIPVIGADGASIDELVEPGKSGELVSVEDPGALARAMLRAWRGEGPFAKAPCPLPPIFAEMEPGVAASNLLHFAGVVKSA